MTTSTTLQWSIKTKQHKPRHNPVFPTITFSHTHCSSQALVYPLTVASKSQHNERVSAAVSVLKTMQQHSARLVAQADLVSGELIRVAILWYEMWHEVSVFGCVHVRIHLFSAVPVSAHYFHLTMTS